MTARTDRRPVRVTIDGEAYSPAEGVLIVVRQDGGKIVFPSTAEGITVEDVVPSRVWTDGDVIADGMDVWARREGAWFKAGDRRSIGAGDEMANRSLARFPYSVRVLRYQSGGDS